MSWLSALRVLVTSLPALLDLLNELIGWLKDTFGETPAKAIQEHAEAIRTLRNAKTPEEKQKASRAIADLISRL